MIVTIGVKEHIELTHEIEIEVEDGKMPNVKELLARIEKDGVEDVYEYAEGIEGVEIEDTFIEEVPRKDDVRFDAWIIETKED